MITSPLSASAEYRPVLFGLSLWFFGSAYTTSWS